MRSVNAAFALAFLAFTACSGRPLPLSAQAGSSIAIPLAGWPAANVGYGGTTVEDRQRGELVVRLDGPSGLPLVTRGVTAVRPLQAAPFSRSPVGFHAAQVFLLLDIPVEAPLGSHTLHITRERGGVQLPAPSYPGTIKILQPTLDVPLDGGGMEEVSGQPTPFEAFNWGDTSQHIPLTVPSPEVRIQLTPPVWSLELSIDYDPLVLDVLEAYHAPFAKSPNGQGIVWIDDDGAGTVRVSATSANASVALDWIALVFELDPETTETLDVGEVTVEVLSATDANGNPVSGASATVDGIY